MPIATLPDYATQTLTASGVFTNTQTVVVGGKTYTTQTTLTDVDGNVLIGANAEATLANLKAAINLEDRPSLIICHTHIAHGAPNAQDTAASHGSPLGDEEVALAKGVGLDPAHLRALHPRQPKRAE